MRVYLCRHAEAAPGDPDDLRELTANGAEQAHALGERLSVASLPPRVVLTSPLVRARQTAEAVADAIGVAVEPRNELLPGATVASLRRALDGVAGPVAVVGHQPDCSEIALAVSGADPGFAPGAMAELELDT